MRSTSRSSSAGRAPNGSSRTSRSSTASSIRTGPPPRRSRSSRAWRAGPSGIKKSRGPRSFWAPGESGKWGRSSLTDKGRVSPSQAFLNLNRSSPVPLAEDHQVLLKCSSPKMRPSNRIPERCRGGGVRRGGVRRRARRGEDQPQPTGRTSQARSPTPPRVTNCAPRAQNVTLIEAQRAIVTLCRSGASGDATVAVPVRRDRPCHRRGAGQARAAMPPPRCRSAVSRYAIEANDQPTKPTAALPPARAGAREELLSRPHRAGGLRLVAKRPVGLAAPRPKRQHLAVGVHGAPTQVLVDDPGALAALGYRGHDQRLADPRVAARVDVADGGAVRLVGTDVAAAVEVQPELRHEAVVLGVLESDRDPRQVGLEHELPPG